MNPHYGKWVTDDEETKIEREPVDRISLEILKALERGQYKKARILLGPAAKKQRRRVQITSRTTPFPLPLDGDVYSRPFKREEAEILLRTAGIAFRRVDTTYIADAVTMTDPATARPLYPAAQCVVAELPAEVLGRESAFETIANVHLFFVWGTEKKGKGWKLIKAMVEKVV